MSVTDRLLEVRRVSVVGEFRPNGRCQIQKWSKTDQKKGLLVVSLSPFSYFYGHVTGFEDASAPILGHVKSTQGLYKRDARPSSSTSVLLLGTEVRSY